MIIHFWCLVTLLLLRKFVPENRDIYVDYAKKKGEYTTKKEAGYESRDYLDVPTDDNGDFEEEVYTTMKKIQKNPCYLLLHDYMLILDRKYAQLKGPWFSCGGWVVLDDRRRDDNITLSITVKDNNIEPAIKKTEGGSDWIECGSIIHLDLEKMKQGCTRSSYMNARNTLECSASQ